MRRSLGVCYYPEHWDESLWAEDAHRMAELGLAWVRIGEFAWSRIEPAPGKLDWDWLDRAVATLGEAGLKVVLGTPTATPPIWMVERHPDMLPVDRQGHPRHRPPPLATRRPSRCPGPAPSSSPRRASTGEPR